MAAGVNVWHLLGLSRVAPCVVTSGNDSKHGADSLHPKDRALDFRTRTIAEREDKFRFRDTLRAALGPDFDVVLEDVGGPNEHLHAEYDPKAAPSQLV